MNLEIKNVESMLVFLRSVLQIVPDALAGAKFEIGPEVTEVKVVNDSKTVRTFFTTNVITAEEPTIIYFQDVTKLFKSISLIKDIEETNIATLNFTGQFITYENSVKFRLRTQKAETIERFCTEPIKAVLSPIYGFCTNHERIKKVIQCAGIVNNSEAKVYFVKQGNGLIAEIDEKRSKMVDSVGLPITDKVEGEVTEVACVNLENFRLFTILPVDNINVILTDKNALTINSEYKNGDAYISMYLVCSLTKGV
jgi:hypothetical protein